MLECQEDSINSTKASYKAACNRFFNKLLLFFIYCINTEAIVKSKSLQPFGLNLQAQDREKLFLIQLSLIDR